MRHLHQLLVGATEGDAISGMAFNTQRWLQPRFNSSIYVALPHESVHGRVWSMADIDREPATAPFIYHASYGLKSVRDVVERRRGPLILMYHNVTPAHFFKRIDPEFAVGLDRGRDELAELSDRFELSLAASEYSANELRNAGHTNVHALPLGLDPHRLTRLSKVGSLEVSLRDHFPHGYVVAVSQLLPHKSIEDLITAVWIVRQQYGRRIGLVVVGTPRSNGYSQGLVTLAERLLGESVRFTGSVTDAELATYLSSAECYVSASRHEGLGIPLLEAMALGVPTIARAGSAVTETAAGAAALVSEDAGSTEFAEALDRVLGSTQLKCDLRNRGRRRIESLDLARTMVKFEDLIKGVGI